MSDLRIRPDLIQSWITHIDSDGQSVVVWAQNDSKNGIKFHTILRDNYNQLIQTFFSLNRCTERPQICKYYVFCCKSRLNFYRVFVKSIDPNANQSMVQFIDFGYDELVSNHNLFVFDGLFRDCKPLAQKYVLADIGPKDTQKGWDVVKVCNSLKPYLQTVCWFEIYDKYIRVYDDKSQQILIQTLLDDCPEEVVIAPNDMNNTLFAIQYIVSPIGSTFSSVSDITQKPIEFNLKNENEIKIEEKSREDTNCKIKVEINNESNDGLIEDTKTESDLKTTDNLIDFDGFVDKTDKNSSSFHLSTLFGPKRLVYITKTFTNNSFYCQLSENYDTIEELTQSLNQFYNKTLETKKFELNFNDLRNDLVIAAQFTTDKNWYRASVQVLNNSQTEVQVLYIDFGNCESLDMKFCRQLVPEFRSLPPQAIHCRPLNKGLGADTLEMYETNGLEIECEFVALNENTIDVRLYEKGDLLKDSKKQSLESISKALDESKELDPKVEQKIIEDSLSMSSINRSLSDINKMINNLNNEMIGTEETVCKSSPEIVPNMSSNVENNINSDSKTTDKLIDLDESPGMSEKALKIVRQSSELRDKTDRKSLIYYLKALFGPKRMVYITKTLNERSIYCQLAENYDIINNITQKLNTFYNQTLQTDEYNLDPNDVEPESVIAAQYSGDKNWYRASVRVVNSNKTKVMVFYIDFGNYETLELKFCRQLVPKFRAFDIQAIHCRPLNICLSAQTLEAYETNGVELECEFIALDGDIIDVKLYSGNGDLLKDSVKESVISEKKVTFDCQEREETAEEAPKETHENLPRDEDQCDSNVETVVPTHEIDSNIRLHLEGLCGYETKVLITSALSAKSIYCQLIENRNTFESLIEDMTDYYNQFLNTSEHALTPSDVKNNRSLIAAFSNLEGKWFRAQVWALKDEHQLEVFYVDIGSKEFVELVNCKQLLDMYVSPAPMAVHCLPTNENISYYTLKRLESSEKVVEAQFGALDDQNVVQILLNV